MLKRLLEKIEGDESKYEYTAQHINGRLVDEGPSVMWGNPHPYGWDKLGEFMVYLSDKFLENGFYNSSKTPKNKSRIWQIKEKFGGIRVYGDVEKEDLPIYRSILADAIDKFPGIAPFLVPDYTEEKLLFTGTAKDYTEWRKNLKDNDLESLIKSEYK